MIEENANLEFDLPKNQSSAIKVLGVGGGGSNAANHMFRQGIKGVDFIVCNTDAQALNFSGIPNKLQLGLTITEGLGAGANPEIGQSAAEESLGELMAMLENKTKMLFITAGMGGGTGTGAAPVIAKAAKEMGILVVGIVTSPFQFEGNVRLKQAEEGIEKLRQAVDSLIVINNNKLREVYGNLGFKAGYEKADEVLATAARGIAEVITHHYTTNIDLRDANTVLADSGTAIMGSGISDGDGRALKGIRQALNSPLLNDNNIKGSKNVLLLIVSGEEEITIDEIAEINEYVQQEAGGTANIILGIGEDVELKSAIRVTIIATGFSADQQRIVNQRPVDKVIHPLNDDQPITIEVHRKPLNLDSPLDLASEAPKPKNVIPDKKDTLDAPIEKKESPAPKVQHLLFDDVVEPTQSEPISNQADASVDNNQDPIFFEKSNEIKEEQEAEEVGFTFDFLDMDLDEEKEFELNATETKEDSVQPIEAKVVEEELTMEIAEDAPIVPEVPTKKVYELEDYMKHEDHLLGKNKKAEKQETQNREPSIELRTRENKSTVESEPVKKTGGENPFDLPLKEVERNMAEDRKARLQSLTYNFRNTLRSVSESENIPAYKRQGIELGEDDKYSDKQSIGQMTIEGDGKGAAVRNNNRFLHDNVD
jgi:cell division protein FtsZ